MSILSSTNSGLRNEKLLVTDFYSDNDFVVSAHQENKSSVPIFYVDSYKDSSCYIVASPTSYENNPDFTIHFRFNSSILNPVKHDTYSISSIETIIIDTKYHFKLVKQYINTPNIEEKKKIIKKLKEK